MGLRTVGFGNMLDEIKQAEDDVWIPNFSTVIECVKCYTKTHYHDLIQGKELDQACECGNLRFKAVPATQAKYTHFIGVVPREAAPAIYEIPYEEYLKTKE
jgi:hypothetical protein